MGHQIVTTMALALVAALMSFDASGAMVTYGWVPGYNSPTPSGGVGTLTFDSAQITDPSNFASVASGALTQFAYAWNNGETFIASDSHTLSVAAPGWSASNGFLTSVFTILRTSPSGSYSLAGQPYDPTFPGYGASSNNVNTVLAAAEIDAGYWRLQSAAAPVPLPGSLWLLLVASAGLWRVSHRLAGGRCTAGPERFDRTKSHLTSFDAVFE